MTNKYKAGLIQLQSGINVDENLKTAETLISQAAEQGAKIIFTPEMTPLLDRTPGRVEAQASFEEDDGALKTFRTLAENLEVYIALGSAPIKAATGKLVNRSFIISPEGEIIASYDKIHMFDVDLPDGQHIRESEKYQAGCKPVVCKTDAGNIGLSICYDVRFPHLYRDLSLAGADLICVPSAFTAPTGKAHWHPLLRARAIETGAYVIAAAQGGKHQDGRETYGHSLVVDPWGEIILEADDKPTFGIFEYDLAKVENARRAIPNLANFKDYQKPELMNG